MVARQVIPVGTTLWRVHRANVAADDLRGRGGGGVHLSAAQSTALVEELLRSREFTANGVRTLVRRQLRDLRLSAVRTAKELTLLRLVSDQDFEAAQEQTGLIERQVGRRVVGRVRGLAADTHGVVWSSSLALPEPTMVLFGENCPADALEPVEDLTISLDDRAGWTWLNETLRPYRVRVRPPVAVEPPLVFVNYRSSDDKQAALWVDDELRGRYGDAAVFRDNRSLPAGVDFAPDILAKVRGAKVLVVLIGERWERTYDSRGRRLIDDKNDWVRREIVEAQARGAHIVPVLIGARAWIRAEDLPDDISKVAGLQHLQLRRGYTERDVCMIIDELVRDSPTLTAKRCRRAHG